MTPTKSGHGSPCSLYCVQNLVRDFIIRLQISSFQPPPPSYYYNGYDDDHGDEKEEPVNEEEILISNFGNDNESPAALRQHGIKSTSND